MLYPSLTHKYITFQTHSRKNSLSFSVTFRLMRSRSPSPLPRRSRPSSPLLSESPTRAQLTNSSRHARLVSRFSDLYAVERLEAQSTLRRYIDDLEMVQRILFIATMVGSLEPPRSALSIPLYM